jgi:hypothetical protein
MKCLGYATPMEVFNPNSNVKYGKIFSGVAFQP